MVGRQGTTANCSECFLYCQPMRDRPGWLVCGVRHLRSIHDRVQLSQETLSMYLAWICDSPPVWPFSLLVNHAKLPLRRCYPWPRMVWEEVSHSRSPGLQVEAEEPVDHRSAMMKYRRTVTGSLVVMEAIEIWWGPGLHPQAGNSDRRCGSGPPFGYLYGAGPPVFELVLISTP